MRPRTLALLSRRARVRRVALARWLPAPKPVPCKIGAPGRNRTSAHGLGNRLRSGAGPSTPGPAVCVSAEPLIDCLARPNTATRKDSLWFREVGIDLNQLIHSLGANA